MWELESEGDIKAACKDKVVNVKHKVICSLLNSVFNLKLKLPLIKNTLHY